MVAPGLATKTCWAYGKLGHIVANCPDSKARDEYDARRGNGLYDQADHQHNVCPVKKALIAGKNVGMVDGSMRVLVTSAHEQQSPAATTDLCEPIEYTDNRDQGMQTFETSSFLPWSQPRTSRRRPQSPPTGNYEQVTPTRTP